MPAIERHYHSGTGTVQNDGQGAAMLKNIADSTASGAKFHRMCLARARAFGFWLEYGGAARDEWDRARAFLEAAWEESRQKNGRELWPDGFDDYMAFCVQAEQYNVGIAMYEKHIGTQGIPRNRTLKQEEFAYLVCLHYANKDFDKKLLAEAGKKMLQKHMENDWLGKGQYMEAAIWLKIVYAIEGSALKPLDVILKAYDNMPHVQKPSFLTMQ